MANVERTGWRDDKWINNYHRTLGGGFPISDLDWVVCEYKGVVPKAIIEYKMRSKPRKRKRMSVCDAVDPRPSLGGFRFGTMKRIHAMGRTAVLLAWLTTSFLGRAQVNAFDIVSFRQGDVEYRVEGRALITATDGVLLQGRDGSIWVVKSEQIIQRETSNEEFRPYSREQMQQQLTRQLPAGFRFFETNNYLVAYNTSRVYAQWCAALFERLNRAFQNYWRKRGVALSDPEFPLVAVIFERRDEYEAFSRGEVGPARLLRGSRSGLESARGRTW